MNAAAAATAAQARPALLKTLAEVASLLPLPLEELEETIEPDFEVVAAVDTLDPWALDIGRGMQ